MSINIFSVSFYLFEMWYLKNSPTVEVWGWYWTFSFTIFGCARLGKLPNFAPTGFITACMYACMTHGPGNNQLSRSPNCSLLKKLRASAFISLQWAHTRPEPGLCTVKWKMMMIIWDQGWHSCAFARYRPVKFSVAKTSEQQTAANWGFHPRQATWK